MKWETAPISEVCRGIFDGPHATPAVSENGAIFLGISNITADGHLNLDTPRYISEADFPKWTKRVTPQAGDIVFSYEATLNLYAIIPEGFHGCLGRRMALIRPNEEKIDGKFLYYYFFSDGWRRVISENTVIGATVDRIPLIRFPDFPVSYPPMEEQKAIAAMLSDYDRLIENNQKQIKLLEEAAQRLYKEWFVDLRFPGYENTKIVDGVPEGWKKGYLRELIDVNYGKDHKRAPNVGSIPVYGSGGIMRKCDQFLYDGEAVLIPRKGSLNNIFYVNGKFWTVDTMFFATPKKQWIAPYVYFFLKKYDMYAMNIGAAVPSMTVKILDSMDVLLPSDDVLYRYYNLVRPFFIRMKILEQQLEKLNVGRDGLLPKLMNGKIEV